MVTSVFPLKLANVNDFSPDCSLSALPPLTKCKSKPSIVPQVVQVEVAFIIALVAVPPSFVAVI